MKKFLFIISALLCLVLHYPEVKGINNQYEVYLEQIELSEEIIYVAGDLRIVKHENIYILKRGNQWEIDLGNEINFKLIYLDNFIYLTSFDEGLIMIRKIDLNGTVLHYEPLTTNEVASCYDFVYYEDYFYFCGGVSEYTSPEFIAAKNKVYLEGVDCFLIKLSSDLLVEEINLYGGYLDERFTNLVVTEEKIIVSGYKDQMTGGDFGNSGLSLTDNIFLATLNHNLELEKISTFQTTSPVNDLYFSNNEIILFTTTNLYYIDSNLNLIRNYPIPKARYSFLAPNLFVVFSETNIHVFNNNLLEFTYKHNLNNISHIIIDDEKFDVYTNGDSLAKITVDIIKIIDNSSPICILDYCLLPHKEIQVYTPFQKAKLIDTKTSPHYERLVHGTYEFTLTYEIRESREINYTQSLEVISECNISDGGIYPTGYRLNFTGFARLNGVNIFNNYQIDYPGEYQLELTSANGEVKQYNFVVDEKQFNFAESMYKRWDIAVFRGEQFKISIPLSPLDYTQLDDITFNKKYTRLTYNQETENLEAFFKAPLNTGLYVYSLESIRINNHEIKVKEVYIINVLNEVPSFNIEAIDETQYQLLVNDPDCSLRHLTVKVINNEDEFLYTYPLGSGVIRLDNIELLTGAVVELLLTYELGDGKLHSFTWLELVCHPNNEVLELGEFKIAKASDAVETLNLKLTNKFSKNNLREINYHNQNIAIPQTNNKQLYVWMSIVAIAASFGVWLIKKFIIKRN